MSESAAVLFANDAFYHAFAAKNIDTMESLWARETPVTCIHPGWGLLSGREDVIESWRDILDNPSDTNIRCRYATARLFGDLAYVVCHEVLDQGFLIATNVFVREDGAWKLVHHQAGTAPPPPEDDEPDPSETMQ